MENALSKTAGVIRSLLVAAVAFSLLQRVSGTQVFSPADAAGTGAVLVLVIAVAAYYFRYERRRAVGPASTRLFNCACMAFATLCCLAGLGLATLGAFTA